MSETIFPQGIFFNPRTPNQPEFVKGRVSFKVVDACAFLKAHTNEKGYCNIDLLKSREGKMYFKLNEFKSKENPDALTGAEAERVKTIRENAQEAAEFNQSQPESTEIPF